VEAIENRVIYGKPAVRILLAGALVYALLYVFRSLALDFFWPATQFIVALISNGPRPNISRNLLSTLPWVLAAGTLGAATAAANVALSKLYFRFKAIESALDKYRSMLWQPLTLAEKIVLSAELAALGQHQVQISTNENPDCIELGNDLKECFEKAGWNVAARPLTGAFGAIGATGLRGIFKGQRIVAASIFSPFRASQSHETQGVELPSSDRLSFDIEVWIIVGPKRLDANTNSN
jgi:hypothetical protein